MTASALPLQTERLQCVRKSRSGCFVVITTAPLIVSDGGGPSSRHQPLAEPRTTEIHALTDAECRPLAVLLTSGQVADCTAGAALLEQFPKCDILHGDKGYDANAIRQQVEERGAMPNIPPGANRKWKNCFSPFLYRNRNAIERMFCRLKDFRRGATRYDRNAVNFLAAVCIAASATGCESGSKTFVVLSTTVILWFPKHT